MSASPEGAVAGTVGALGGVRRPPGRSGADPGPPAWAGPAAGRQTARPRDRPGRPGATRSRASFVPAHHLLAMRRIERAFLHHVLRPAPVAAEALDRRLDAISAEAARGTCPLSVSRMRWELLAGLPYERLASAPAQLHVPRPVRDDEYGRAALRAVERRRSAGDTVVVVADFFGPCIAHHVRVLGEVTLLCPVPDVDAHGLLTGGVDRPMAGEGLATVLAEAAARLGLDNGGFAGTA